jgi:hypothetical protein
VFDGFLIASPREAEGVAIQSKLHLGPTTIVIASEAKQSRGT